MVNDTVVIVPRYIQHAKMDVVEHLSIPIAIPENVVLLIALRAVVVDMDLPSVKIVPIQCATNTVVFVPTAVKVQFAKNVPLVVDMIAQRKKSSTIKKNLYSLPAA